MRGSPWALALASIVGVSAAQAAGTVEVSFIHPEEFSDVGRGSVEIEQNTQALGEFLKKQAKRLPDGQTLRVEVLDVDLAGELRPFRRSGQEIRVLKGRADWPSMKLRYTLLEGGRALRSGEERISDLNYQFGIHPSQRDEPMAYDRRLLERWITERFVPERTAAAR